VQRQTKINGTEDSTKIDLHIFSQFVFHRGIKTQTLFSTNFARLLGTQSQNMKLHPYLHHIQNNAKDPN
jgi:hypothetical protein